MFLTKLVRKRVYFAKILLPGMDCRIISRNSDRANSISGMSPDQSRIKIGRNIMGLNR